ncbi:hypothetical protein [Streptomyces sp. NPDC002054]|uniref:hypothetical protein n=1 Tax=Streptomyces sp. NPDC002054 TaxID=3154663 RepID=UPI00332C2800
MGIRNRRNLRELHQEMVRLCDELDLGLGDPAPSDIDELIAGMAARLSLLRGRPVRIVRKNFPAGVGPVSGLWLDRETEDVIVVVRSTSPFHSLGILGHEIWHMMRGHCGSHTLGAHVATRLVGDELTDGQLDEAVRLVAARKAMVPGDQEEVEAEGSAHSAVALGEEASRRGLAYEGFARTVQRRIAVPVTTAWDFAAGQDIRYPGATGPKPPIAARLLNSYLGRFMRTSTSRSQVTEALFEVMSLSTLRPTPMFRPAVLWAVLRGPSLPPLAKAPLTAHETSTVHGRRVAS